MTKAINKAIRIYSFNYLNKNCQFDYGGQDIAISDFLKLCDFEPYNEDIIFGKNTENTSLNFSSWFKDKFGDFLSRDLDIIIIQNTNIQTMNIKYLDMDGTEITVYRLIDNIENEIRITLPKKITTSKIIFEILSTNDNSGVKIGQLRILEKLFDLAANH